MLNIDIFWKARNNIQFDKKICMPPQVYAEANAILQGFKLEGTTSPEVQQLLQPSCNPRNTT
jgi:hypothetical protein